MDANTLYITEEQKETVLKALNIIREGLEVILEKIKEAFEQIQKAFSSYIASLEPKKRYKFLKKIGVKNYVPFFKRKVFRCRNNC